VTVYPDLRDYCEIAADLLGTTPEQIARLPRIGLADSALASPRAGFGDHDAYPTLVEKGAVLVEHLARNHPLPDGNKRAAFLTLWLFMELNGQPFTAEAPDTDTPIVERIAAGEAPTAEVIEWLEQRTAPS
jgi:death-on-curing protein